MTPRSSQAAVTDVFHQGRKPVMCTLEPRVYRPVVERQCAVSADFLPNLPVNLPVRVPG